MHKRVTLLSSAILLSLASLLAQLPAHQEIAGTDSAYLFTYILPGDTERTNSFFAAGSTDGQTYTVLNNNKALVYPLAGSRKMRTPRLFRKPDGGFGLIATDNNSSNSVLLYHSPDLITYEEETLLTLSDAPITVSNAVCVYDNSRQTYLIRWEGGDGKKYESSTTDLKTLSGFREISGYPVPAVLQTAPEAATDVSVITLSREEYEKVMRKYAPVTNTGIAPLPAITVRSGEPVNLPERVTVEYSDGSSKQLGVSWDTSSINFTQPGKYTLKGTVRQPEYPDPFIRQRADPWITRGDDGYYYFTASYPMVGKNDPEGYDRIILRRAETLEGLASAEEISIWHEKDCPSCHRYVWAPEIHQIDGTWYVFFTTSVSDNVWHIRPRVISCTLGERDPYHPDCWEDTGHLMQPARGDAYSFTHFSLDMTHFTNKGTHYVVWAEKPDTSDLLIASVEGEAPWKATSPYTLLTRPEYAWEHDGNTWVNEGPAVIKNNGKIYLAYSASAVNHTYCVGLLYADEDADLLDAASWTKLRYPVLSTEDLPANQNGPGHNSFTVDEYGNPVIVYHARDPRETIDGGLYDPGRNAHVKSIHFAYDGTPVLNMTREQELHPLYKEVSVEVVVR